MKKTSPPPPVKTIHDQLAERFDKLGLYSSPSVEYWSAPVDWRIAPTLPPVRYLVGGEGEPVQLLVARQFEFTADAVVHDAVLGTLAIFHLLPEASSAPGPVNTEELRKTVAKRLDEATYLRHLLLRDAEQQRQNPPPTPYTVEVIFVARREADPAVPLLGDLLRELMRVTTFLHAIGVNVWEWPLESARHERRALAWLLLQSRQWLQGNPPPIRSLRSLEIEHFRLPGERVLRFAPGYTLHLVHGHNGTGKSSLVEALELAVTGGVERLEAARKIPGAAPAPGEKEPDDPGPDYALVLTNSKAAANRQPARVKLSFDRGPRPPRQKWEVKTGGVDKPMAPKLPAAAFRLDQRVADWLSADPGGERAADFSRTFFPEDVQSLEDFKAGLKNLHDALRKLPASQSALTAAKTADGLPDATELLKQLGWLLPPKAVAPEEVELPWEKIRALWGLNETQFATIEPMLSDKAPRLWRRTGSRRWPDALKDAVEIDKALEACRTRAAPLGPVLAAATAALQGLGATSFSASAAVGGDLGTHLKAWLERMTVCDLVEKTHQVQTILEEINGAERPLSWSPEVEAILRASSRLPAAATRETVLTLLRKERDEALDTFHRFALSPAAVRAARHRTAASLGDYDLAALDDAAHRGLLGEEFKTTNPSLSHALTTAFEEHRAVPVRSATGQFEVGKPGWADPLLDHAKHTSEAWKILLSTRDTVSTLLPALQDAAVAAEAFRNIKQDRLNDFVARFTDDGPLSRAFNELVALLTPARWAYSDLITAAKWKAVRQELGFKTLDGVKAHLRLNTAELNTFALSLFLLCARQVAANPLGMLVLDDPLQNMDELTVTTVARGLGKLMRLWQDTDRSEDSAASWQLFVLLHGEEDSERVRREVPCDFVPLPWLSPAAPLSGGKANLEAETSWIRDQLQPLATLIA